MEARAHVDAFQEAFDAARRACPSVDREYAFGGASLAARIVGAELAAVIDRPLLPADRPGRPRLRLDLWDGSTGVPVPALREVAGLEERGGPAGERVAHTPDGRLTRFSGPHMALWLDGPERRLVGWVRDAASLSPWQRYRPLQTLLGPWFRDTGRRILHAAATAGPAGAVVVCGPNGVGKSTTAMACVAAGHRLLGDDVVAVDPAAAEVHALYAVAKLRVAPGYLTGVEALTDTRGNPEWVTYLREAAPAQLTASAPIAALAFPTLVPSAASSVEAIARGRATRILLGADQAPVAGQVGELLTTWSELLERVPAVQLRVGRDPDRLAGCMAALLNA